MKMSINACAKVRRMLGGEVDNLPIKNLKVCKARRWGHCLSEVGYKSDEGSSVPGRSSSIGQGLLFPYHVTSRLVSVQTEWSKKWEHHSMKCSLQKSNRYEQINCEQAWYKDAETKRTLLTRSSIPIHMVKHFESIASMRCCCSGVRVVGSGCTEEFSGTSRLGLRSWAP